MNATIEQMVMRLLLYQPSIIHADCLFNTGRKATFPAPVFTKDMQGTGQISYTCLAPVVIRIVENFHGMS